MSDETTTVPDMDQFSSDDSHDDSLADILANSPIMKMVAEEDKTPSDDYDDETDESDEGYLEDSDEDANTEDGNEGEEDDAEYDEGSEDEQSSTQDDQESGSEEDDIDWDFDVPVKIDGEESLVSLEELRKGYQTQQHLSNQGRELGEQRKLLEQESKDKLDEIVGMADAMSQSMMAEENKYGLEYNTVKDEIAQMRKDGDKFGLADKKDELDVAQEKYWEARKGRESTQGAIKVKQDGAKQLEWDAKVKDFSERIHQFVPDFDETTATAVRTFAIEQGVPDSIVDQVTSPEMVKFVNDYRLQMEKLNKGSAKRKQTVKRKANPTKKNPTGRMKANQRKQNTSAQLANGTLSDEDGDAFLKSLASKHFK